MVMRALSVDKEVTECACDVTERENLCLHHACWPSSMVSGARPLNSLFLVQLRPKQVVKTFRVEDSSLTM